ncbi:hypothetical protein [Acinetobacter sp. ANC5681]|uniref:hypothetical protein n=1 Tax=Acinetobacter sp. ANC5681 TaxID=2929504 RepID=UPI00201A3728|nr:hypothetical protein [Acinetobacter sp. ANC5681]MCL5769659.1 hypothetical protein [Acinetobacter sp. ANC5681]
MREIAQAEAMSFEQQLIFTLKTMYAQQFAKHFADMPMNIVGNVISAALVGVDQDGFNRGMARLLSGQSKFMPTVQEFKSWCVSGTWSSTEAWYHVCEWSRDSKHKITVLAKQCWDEIYHIVLDGNIKEAQRQFVNLYEDRLARMQLQGVKQEIYVPPVAIPVKTIERAQKPIGAGLTAEQTEKLKSLAQSYFSKGMLIVAAFNQASIDVMGKGIVSGDAV